MLSKNFLFMLLLLSGISCKTRKPAPEPEVRNYAALNYEKGTVKFWELDGCRYLIELENGNKLNPDNLDAAYSVNDLKVWVNYKKVDRMNICMSGITVDIIDIQKRTDE